MYILEHKSCRLQSLTCRIYLSTWQAKQRTWTSGYRITSVEHLERVTLSLGCISTPSFEPLCYRQDQLSDRVDGRRGFPRRPGRACAAHYQRSRCATSYGPAVRSSKVVPSCSYMMLQFAVMLTLIPKPHPPCAVTRQHNHDQD